MNENIENKVERIKKLLNELVEKGELDYALEVINKCENVIKNDAEIISMKGIIYYVKNEIEKAEEIFKKGLLVDSTYADFYYNLGCVYELKEEYEKAAKFFTRALEFVTGEETIEIGKKLNEILCKISTPLKDETKIAFFVKPGLDSFLNDIILGLMDEYFVRKITVTDFKQIDEGMQWADICWFEWCDELVIYGSRHELAGEKKIICRLHRYEAFTNYIFQVEWENVDKVIFVASHILNIVNSKLGGKIREKSIIIPNGINLQKYNFRDRKKGFNIAYVGYLNYRKSPNMLLQIIGKLIQIDKRYRLFIAGEFQDEENMTYFEYLIKEMGLKDYVIFEGWQKDINTWLEDKDYILSCSIFEGHPVGIMEAMAKGIKPVIHNFVGAKDIYPSEWLWNTIDEAVTMIMEEDYNSEKYREFIKEKYSLQTQIDKIKRVILETEDTVRKKGNFCSTREEKNIEKSNWDKIWRDASIFEPEQIMNDPATMTLRSEFVNFLNRYFVLKGAKIIEMGCGTGQFSAECALRGCKVLGIDISENSIKIANEIKKRYKITGCNFKVLNALETGFSDSEFDIAFNMGVIEHFNDEEIIKFLKEMSRISKYVVVGVPYTGSEVYKMAKAYLIKNERWIYGYEKDFYTLFSIFDKAGLILLKEEVLGYYSEAAYLRRIDNDLFETCLSNNFRRFFEGRKNVGCWLVAIGTKKEEYANLFNKLNNERIRFENLIALEPYKNPSVSIIIPFYNAENFIERQLLELSRINYSNYEVIFVNDGSSDKSERILLMNKENINNFKYVNLDSNVGLFDARHAGLKIAEGEYVFFSDVDDFLYPHCIRNLVNDIYNFTHKVLLSVSCCLRDNTDFKGIMWMVNYLPTLFDYVKKELYTLSGQVGIINTLLETKQLREIYGEIKGMLSSMKIKKFIVGEDTIIVDWMILKELIDNIIPVYYTFRGYFINNEFSASKNITQRLKDIPLTKALELIILKKKLNLSPDTINDYESLVYRRAVEIYGKNSGETLFNNFLCYKNILEEIL